MTRELADRIILITTVVVCLYATVSILAIDFKTESDINDTVNLQEICIEEGLVYSVKQSSCVDYREARAEYFNE